MYYETYAQFSLRLAHTALAEHTKELTAFADADATATRKTYGAPLTLTESLFHARMLRHLRTKSAILVRAQEQWLKLAYKDDDPDGDWDDMWAYDDLEKFGDHFNKHRHDFDAKDWNDYAKQSQDFYKRAQTEKLPTILTYQGWNKIYDPKSNTFGIYNPQGKTETFYKPKSTTYFTREIQKESAKGGVIINPLPDG